MDINRLDFRALAQTLAEQLETLDERSEICRCCGHTRWHAGTCPIPYLHSLQGDAHGQEDNGQSAGKVG